MQVRLRRWQVPTLGALGVMLAVSFPFALRAQSTSPQPNPDAKKLAAEKQAAAKIRVVSTLVTTPVTVFDSAGSFIYDLTQNDFRLFDDGAPQRLEKCETAVDPIAAVIVVETNDSVAALLPHVRPLGSIFSSLMLGPQGVAAVVTYDDGVRAVQEFSSDGDTLSKTLRDLKPRGSRARLNDALARAISLLEQRPKNERRVIVVFSEGSDRGSETKSHEVIRRATGSEVAVYGLRFSPAQALLRRKPPSPGPNAIDNSVARPLPPGVAATPSNDANVSGNNVPIVPIVLATGEVISSAVASNALESYCGYTGGVYRSHWSKGALQEQLSKISSEIHAQYELAYVPNNLNETGFHKIRVEVNRPGVKVRTRAGYFYAGKTP